MARRRPDRDVGRSIRGLVTGGRLPRSVANDEERQEMIASAAWLIHGRESIRQPSNVAFSAMAMGKGERGEMQLDDVLAHRGLATIPRSLGGGFLPATMQEYGEAHRTLERHTARTPAQKVGSPRLPKRGPAAVRRRENLRMREINLAELWLK